MTKVALSSNVMFSQGAFSSCAYGMLNISDIFLYVTRLLLTGWPKVIMGKRHLQADSHSVPYTYSVPYSVPYTRKP